MTSSLNELTTLSTRCKVSHKTYQFIISDGYRWDTFRKAFEKKKWFVEGAFIGCRFLDFARQNVNTKEHEREMLLCYNFLLNMFDKADFSDAFCESLMLGFSEIDWKVTVYTSPLSESELGFISKHFPNRSMITTEVNPLYIWINRYLVNEQKILSGRHYHLQNDDVLSMKLQNIDSLLNFLIDCT